MSEIEQSVTLNNCKIDNPQEILDKLWELGFRPSNWAEIIAEATKK